MIKFAHTNIITDNWQRLAQFYIDVFDCKPLHPERNLSGDWIDKATSITNAHFKGIHLVLPGYDNNLPTLEIFQYDHNEENLPPLTNRKGFGHIAFRVDDAHAVLQKLLEHGGSTVGQVVTNEIPGAGAITFVYAKDIDGNIVEIQSWA